MFITNPADHLCRVCFLKAKFKSQNSKGWRKRHAFAIAFPASRKPGLSNAEREIFDF
jgi:hypothetical protein